MTDKERIEDLERRIDQLEDIIKRLNWDESGLWIYTPDAPEGTGRRRSYSNYLIHQCTFGKKEANDGGNT